MSVIDRRRNQGSSGADFAGELSSVVDELAQRPDAGSIARNLMRLKSFGFDPTDPDIIRRAADLASRAQAVRQKAREPWHEPVVYYMNLGDLVKIGTTTNIHYRMSSISPQGLLAVERGGYAVERARHRAFECCRVHGEWFRNQDPLTAYIDAVACDFAEEFGCSLSEWMSHVRLTPPLRRTTSAGSLGGHALKAQSDTGPARA